MRALALSSQGPFRTSDLGILDLSGTLLSLLPSWTSDLGILDFESALRTRRDKSDFGLGIWDFISTSHQIGSRPPQGTPPPTPPHPPFSLLCSDSDPGTRTSLPLFLRPPRPRAPRVGLSDSGFSDSDQTVSCTVATRLPLRAIVTAGGQLDAHMLSGSCHVRSCLHTCQHEHGHHAVARSRCVSIS